MLREKADSSEEGMVNKLVTPELSGVGTEDFLLLTAKQTAALLQVSLPRVYELARIGLIPCVRIGRQVRFDEAELREWVARGGATEKRQPPQRE